MKSLKIYNVSQQYYNYVRRYDDKVPHMSGNKAGRPFIGIVLEINDSLYFAPLTSPKIKHLRMRNSVDFTKIDEGKLGAINFNNMLPVPESEITEVELKINIFDSKSLKAYKTLLEKQRIWCNEHKEHIYKKAEKLYNLIDNPDRIKIKERCCNFRLLEQKCREYEAGLSLKQEKVFEDES